MTQGIGTHKRLEKNDISDMMMERTEECVSG